MKNKLQPWVWCGVFLLSGLANAVPVAQSSSFMLPSGRLGCAYAEADPAAGFRASIRCDVMEPTFKAPRLKDCEQDQGNSLALEERGTAVWVCHGDTVLDPRNPVLAYGRTWKRGGFTCTSSTAGVRCLNGAGHGFELARGKYRLF